MELAASVKASNQLATTSIQSEGPIVDDCIDLLNAMPQIANTSQLYTVALMSLMVKEKRNVWMPLKLDDARIN